MQYPSGRRIPSLALQLSSTNDHQELVSANLSTSTSSTGSITYRNAREDDLAHIATLLTDTFEGPYAWYRQINRRIDIEQMRSQLADRFFRFVLAKKKHSMIVAMHNNDVIGFLELGTLPCPVPRNVTWQNTTVASTAEVPFLGNIAIATDFRRKQVASKLLMIGNKIVQKWNDTEVFVAVECDNTAALRLYQKTGFEVELDERDLIQPPKRNPRIFLRLPIVS